MSFHAGGNDTRSRAVPLAETRGDVSVSDRGDGVREVHAHEEGAKLVYRLPAGSLDEDSYLLFHQFLESTVTPQLEVVFVEHDDPDTKLGQLLSAIVSRDAVDADLPSCKFHYTILNRRWTTVSIPLEPMAAQSGIVRFTRDGSLLCPRMHGSAIDPERVRTIVVTVRKLPGEPVRWAQSPLYVTDEPERPSPPDSERVVDALGQSTLDTWDGKTTDESALVERLESQHEAAPDHSWPYDASKWGGRAGSGGDAAGFFSVERRDGTWWFVDPDGQLFWSSGMNCVNPRQSAHFHDLEDAFEWLPDPDGAFADAYVEPNESFTYGDETPDRYVSFVIANFVRAFGADEWYDRWSEVATSQLKRAGFNTFGAWSDWRVAKRDGFPYARLLECEFPNTPSAFMDFPDVYHPAFDDDVEAIAAELEATADDPAMLGYFLGNEPLWGFVDICPALGLLRNDVPSHTREELVSFLEAKYGDETALSRSWGIDVTFASLRQSPLDVDVPTRARNDLREFSGRMVEELYGGLADRCSTYDPNHLNLGPRFVTPPPEWQRGCLEHFDVLSINWYSDTLTDTTLETISAEYGIPVLVGEWSYGAVDAGLPSPGVCEVASQEYRAEAFERFTTNAAATPWCVGAHWFQFYDQSVVGRPDGENYNVGFLDVCNRPYPKLLARARDTHASLYERRIAERQSERPIEYDRWF